MIIIQNKKITSIGAIANSANCLKNVSTYFVTFDSSKKREAELTEVQKIEYRAKRLSQILAMTEAVMTFSDLIENLMSPNKDTSGASVQIPEMFFLFDGKPKYYAYFDQKAKEIKGIYNKSLLKRAILRRMMTAEYTSRKTTSMIRRSKFDIIEETTKSPNEPRVYLPMVTIRSKTKKKDLLQSEFTELTLKLADAKIWKEIDYIQNYIVLCNTMPVITKYIYGAPFDSNNNDKRVKYLQENNKKIIDADARAYAICNSIGDYLAKNRGIVIFLIC